MEVNDTYGFSFTNVAASRMSIKRHSASQAGSEIISIMRDTPYVGIGTTSPVTILDVAGYTRIGNTSSNTARLILGPAPSGTNLDYASVIESTSVVASNYSSTLNFYTHGNGATAGDPTLAMTINSAQQVGIGTASPGNTLDVYKSVNSGNAVRAYNPNTGTAAYGGFIMGTNDAGNRGGIVAFNSTYTASAQYRASGTYVYCNGAGGITLHAEGANNLFFATNSVERMRVTSAGDVGIGTTSPQFRLNSAQDISATGDIQPNTAQFAVMGETTPGKRMVFGYDTQVAGNGYGFIKAGNLGVSWTNISLQPNGGNVGIGVTDPVGKLTVPQSSTAAVIIGSNTNWGGSSGVLKITGTPGFYAPLGTIFAGTSTENHWEIVNANGMVGAVRTSGSTTTYNSLSDYRTKTNVQPLSNALVIISQMKPVRFNFKADLDKDIEGFIAHELQECAPNAVTGEKDAVFADGSINPQCIDMSFLVPFLVAGMQDLSAENTALKQSLASATARLDSLESRLAAAGI